MGKAAVVMVAAAPMAATAAAARPAPEPSGGEPGGGHSQLRFTVSYLMWGPLALSTGQIPPSASVKTGC